MGQLSSAILEYESILQRFPDDADVLAALSEIESKANSLNAQPAAADIPVAEAPKVSAHAAKSKTSGPRPVPTDIDDGRHAGSAMTALPLAHRSKGPILRDAVKGDRDDGGDDLPRPSSPSDDTPTRSVGAAHGVAGLPRERSVQTVRRPVVPCHRRVSAIQDTPREASGRCSVSGEVRAPAPSSHGR